jgi:hypothetical protein
MQRMPGALEQLDVRVAADDDMEVAQPGSVSEELDVPGVEPVEAPGHHHPSRAARARRALVVERREPGQVPRVDGPVVEASGGRSGPQVGIFLRRRNDKGVEPTRKVRDGPREWPACDRSRVHGAKPAGQEEPLHLRIAGWALECRFEQGIRREADVNGSQAGSLLEESNLR